jgi:CRISPR-associated protein Cmr5
MSAKQTTSQKMAQQAYERIAKPPSDEYLSFALSFPSLIHACGLAQAVVFAKAKKQEPYLDDLSAILRNVGRIGGSDDLDYQARAATASAYVQMSRDALRAAGWLKRYAEILSKD